MMGSEVETVFILDDERERYVSRAKLVVLLTVLSVIQARKDW